MTNPTFDFSHLTVAERIQLAHDLWDSLADAPEILELTEAQRAELERRRALHREDPNSAIPWEDVRKELLDDA